MAGRRELGPDQKEGDGGGPAGHGQEAERTAESPSARLRSVVRAPSRVVVTCLTGRRPGAGSLGAVGSALIVCNWRRCGGDFAPSGCSFPFWATSLSIFDTKRAENRKARPEGRFGLARCTRASADFAAGAPQVIAGALTPPAARPLAAPTDRSPPPPDRSPPPPDRSPPASPRPSSGLTPSPACSERTHWQSAHPPRSHRPVRTYLPTPATSPGDRG